MGSVGYCIAVIIFAVLLTPLVLVGIGYFGTSWVPGETCNTIGSKVYCCDVHKKHYQSNGSVHNWNTTTCSAPFGVSELDSTAERLQEGAFVIMLLPFIFGLLEIFCSKKDDELGCWATLSGLSFLLYPIAGVLTFVGCMIIAAKFSGSDFGGDFYRCLASSLIVLSFTALSICFICYTVRTKSSSGETAVAESSSSVVVFIQRVDIIHVVLQQ